MTSLRDFSSSPSANIPAYSKSAAEGAKSFPLGKATVKYSAACISIPSHSFLAPSVKGCPSADPAPLIQRIGAAQKIEFRRILRGGRRMVPRHYRRFRLIP